MSLGHVDAPDPGDDSAPYAQPMQVFQRDSNGGFVSIGEPVALLVNGTEESGNWIGLQLKGRDGSRDAIGAIVEVYSGDQRWIEARKSGDGYLCSNERILRVGLGELSGDCNVTVI